MRQILDILRKRSDLPNEHKAESGLTLIELLLYMGLMTIFITVMSEIFLTSLSSQLEAESLSSIEQDGRFILARVGHDISRATVVQDPVTQGSVSAALELMISGVVYRYTLSGGKLVLTDSLGSDEVNSALTTVSNLQFTRRGKTGGKAVITTSFTLTSLIKRESGQDSKTYTATFGTR